MNRQRMTWGGDGRPAPTRHASAHPATPWEGETHPATSPDPEADAYENGDPSSWAEDPHPPPYRTSPAPAYPYDDGGYRHPATQAGAPAKNASMNLRASVERKASKCIRIATALLGQQVASAAQSGDKVATDMIEDQALDLMDLSDARIANTLLRLEASTEDEDTLLRKMLAAEGEDIAEDEEAEAKASKKAAEGDMMAAIMSLKSEIQSLKAGKHYGEEEAPMMGGHYMGGDDDGMDGEDAMLAEMIEQEKMGGHHFGGDDDGMSDEDAMLSEMLNQEKMGGHSHMSESHMSEEDAMLAEMLKEAEGAPEMSAPQAARGMSAPKANMAMPMSEDEEPVMGGYEDPMSMGDEDMMGDDEEAMLASLFASRSAGDEEGEDEESETASKKAGESDEEAEDEEEVMTSSKKASLRPQPKKASAGAKTIGSQTRVASGGGDLGDLARLWASAPDVSKVFGG